MSLATSGGIGGGGGAAGGMMMAHQPNAVGRGAPPQAPPEAKNTTGTGAPPPSAAVLGADLLDKSQGLSLKTVKNLSHLPIVAVDLHGSESQVALYPKKPKDPSKGEPPIAVGAIKTDISFQSNSETASKTLRKFLAKSKTYTTFKTDCLAANTTKSAKKDDAVVVLEKPHRWLGLRRLKDAPEFVRQSVTTEDDEASSAPAILEEYSQGVGVTVANSTLDGGSMPTGDDYDRVVFKVRLHESKKAVSVLPEEAVQMVLYEAQYRTAAKMNVDVNDEEIVDYPCAVAVPAWASHDAAVEAMMDASSGSSGVVCLFQRNVCALAGALLPSIDGRLTPLLDRMNTVRAAQQKDFQRRQAKDPGAILEDEIVLIVLGMTDEGFEATGIQISSANLQNISCLFGDFKVISNVSYQDADPIRKMESCMKELETNMDTIAPEADGPAGIVCCGSLAEQKKIISNWEKIKAAQDEWKKVPVFASAPDTVAKGAAVLGAVSHGRLSELKQTEGKKPRAQLALRVQNVAPAAVGIQMNYHGGAPSKWEPVKTLFDFDRQVPAGPQSLDLKAAECAVYRSGKADSMSEEEFLKATAKNEGAKGIPLREEAALHFSVQLLQKWTRDGEWKKLGDAMEPLVKETEDKDGNVERIACESVDLELSLGVTGMITTNLVGERESVAVATKSARNSAIRYYLGILFAILFFGGFLFKSYYDDYVLERDTKRLLAYYKHVVPGSFHDGDEHNARYTCYKYRNKKDRLWRNLERKYGEPVLQTEEYEELFSSASTEAEEETINLDGDEDTNGKESDEEEKEEL